MFRKDSAVAVVLGDLWQNDLRAGVKIDLKALDMTNLRTVWEDHSI